MNKADLSAALSAKCNVTKKQAEDLLDSLTDMIIETIKNEGAVTLTGFGTFSARVRKGREGVNPQNPSLKNRHSSDQSGQIQSRQNTERRFESQPKVPFRNLA